MNSINFILSRSPSFTILRDTCLYLSFVEIQKIGYLFPGQRSGCYSADMLLRLYKRVRNQQKKKFSYYQIKNVFLIVLYEKIEESKKELEESQRELEESQRELEESQRELEENKKLIAEKDAQIEMLMKQLEEYKK